MRSKKLWIIVGAVALALIFVMVNMKSRRKLPEVEVDKVTRGPVRETVNASGTLKAKTSVDVSATIMGKITRLPIHEGDAVKAGDFLMEIDPKEYESMARGAEAALASAQEELTLSQANLQQADLDLKRAKTLSQQGLRTEEQLQAAETGFKVQQAQVAAAQGRVRQAQANLDRSRHDLSKVTLRAPIAGTITRLNVEEGENAIIGTMNNPGTLLCTIDDLSEMEAEVKVDETEVVKVKLGQPADIKIDAYPDTTFKGLVTEVGNSPIFSQTGIGQQAVDFEVKVTLQSVPEKVRPGLSASADVEVATRTNALTIPIASLVSREWPPAKGKSTAALRGNRNRKSKKPDEKAAAPHEDKAKGDSASTTSANPQGQEGAQASVTDPAAASSTDTTKASTDAKGSKKPKKKEGIFIVTKEGSLEFRPVKVGIAGEERFEVLTGVEEGVTVVSGPFRVLRDLNQGDKVKIVDETRRKRPGGKDGEQGGDKSEGD